MRPPLTRPGQLNDTYQQLAAQRAELDKMLRLASSEPTLEQTGKKHITTAAGDERKLRGIPCIANGVGGTSPGTDPYTETARRNP